MKANVSISGVFSLICIQQHEVVHILKHLNLISWIFFGNLHNMHSLLLQTSPKIFGQSSHTSINSNEMEPNLFKQM